MDRPTRGGGQYVDTRRVHHHCLCFLVSVWLFPSAVSNGSRAMIENHPPVYQSLPLSLTRHDTIVTIHSNLLACNL